MTNEKILDWPNIRRIGIIGCDSKNKKFSNKWRDVDYNLVDYQDNLAQGVYLQGVAAVLGKCLDSLEDHYSLAIDIDGWEAVAALFGKLEDTEEHIWNKVLELANKTRIEWHQNKGRLHILFYSKRPANKVKIHVNNVGLELRYDELLIVSPSIAKDGNRWEVLGTTQIAVLDDKDLTELEQRIGNLADTKIDKDLAIKKVRERNIIREGERHNEILTECNRIIWENIRDYVAGSTSADDIWKQCIEISKRCEPPLPLDELETIFKDSLNHVADEFEADNTKAPAARKQPQSKVSAGTITTKKLKEEKIREVPINKYYNEATDVLYETVYLNNNPCFVFTDRTGELLMSSKVTYMKNTFLVPQTDRNTTKQFYFTDSELMHYWERSAQVTISDLYQMSKRMWLKYVDAEKHIITLCAADTIFTYFQDKSYITHYDYILGENDSGKSIYLDLMAEIGYRAFTAIDISEASLYRAYGSIQEGQCTILLDEANNLAEKIVELLKGGYQKGRAVPRSDTEVEGKRITEAYFVFGFKMLASELGPDGAGLKGFNERVFRIKAMVGFPEMALREVLEDKKIYKEEWAEIEDFKKLMFCWRLRHYSDVLETPKMNVRNRDKELVKPLLKLFNKTDIMPELKAALSIFLKYRRESKGDSLEAAIYKCIHEFIIDKKPDAWHWLDPDTKSKFNLDSTVTNLTAAVPGTAFIDYLVDKNDGQYEKKRYDEVNKLSIEFPYFGKMSHKDISKILHDRFGAERIRKYNKWCYEFNVERIARLEKTYAEFEGLEVYE